MGAGLEELESPPHCWVTMTMRQQEGEMFAMQAHNPSSSNTALVKYARVLRRAERVSQENAPSPGGDVEGTFCLLNTRL